MEERMARRGAKEHSGKVKRRDDGTEWGRGPWAGGVAGKHAEVERAANQRPLA